MFICLFQNEYPQVRNVTSEMSIVNSKIQVTNSKIMKSSLPPLYIITPTYPRSEQLPELARLSQTLRLVDNVVLIIAEDAPKPTETVLQYLQESGLKHVYLRGKSILNILRFTFLIHIFLCDWPSFVISKSYIRIGNHEGISYFNLFCNCKFI